MTPFVHWKTAHVAGASLLPPTCMKSDRSCCLLLHKSSLVFTLTSTMVFIESSSIHSHVSHVSLYLARQWCHWRNKRLRMQRAMAAFKELALKHHKLNFLHTTLTFCSLRILCHPTSLRQFYTMTQILTLEDPINSINCYKKNIHTAIHGFELHLWESSLKLSNPTEPTALCLSFLFERKQTKKVTYNIGKWGVNSRLGLWW